MRKISFFGSVFVALLSIVAAQTQGQMVSTSESALDFGSVALGDTATDIVTVTNISSGDVIVSISFSGDSAFSSDLAGSPTFPSGDDVDINVSFAPSATGDATCALVIDVIGSAGGPEQVVVDLIGTGGQVEDPCVLVRDILDFYNESISNGTLEGTGNCNSNRRVRAMRNRLRAISWLCRHGYFHPASRITRSAILRSDGQSCPRDFVQGVNLQALNDQLILLELLLN